MNMEMIVKIFLSGVLLAVVAECIGIVIMMWGGL